MKNPQFRVWIDSPHDCMHFSCDGGIDILLELIERYGGELLLYSEYLDDNGLKIWEGDILKITDEYGESENVEVKWTYGGLCVEYCFGEFDITTIGWAIECWKAVSSKIEVIGNIFQTPRCRGFSLGIPV